MSKTIKMELDQVIDREELRIAKGLENAIIDVYSEKTGGEYMESLRGRKYTKKELAATAIVLVRYLDNWKWNSQFNDDYRSRILSWLLEQAEDSPVVQAACVTLAGDDRTLEEIVLEKSNTTVRSIQEVAEKAAKSALVSEDVTEAFLVWMAAPYCYDTLAVRIEEFLADSSQVIQYAWYLELASKQFKIGAKGTKRLFSAFQALSTKNVTESTAAFKNLSKSYSRTEVMALNLLMLGICSSSIIMDNVRKNFLTTIAKLSEEAPFTEFEAGVLHETLGLAFCQKVNGSTAIEEFFRDQIERNLYSYHPVFKDTRKWKLLYQAAADAISFGDAGFLAFDPLEDGNLPKWDILGTQHQKQLLEYECRRLYLRDLNESYPVEWKRSMEHVCQLISHSWKEDDENKKEAWESALDNRMDNTVNALIQAGLMEIPGDDGFWYTIYRNEKLRYQYMLRYSREHGRMPEWVTNHFGNEWNIEKSFQYIAETPFPEKEKGEICMALLDAAWEVRPYGYHNLVCSILEQQPELLKASVGAEELASIARMLIDCPSVAFYRKEALFRYIMSEDEWEERRKEAERQKQEEEELEELEKLQETARNTVRDIAGSSDTWQITNRIQWFSFDAFKPDLARIATWGIKEKDIPTVKKIKAYAEIAEAAGCDTYLYAELKEIIEERG